MYRNKTIAAVVPAYREEALIAKVITTMPDFVDHIVIVDDCSTGRTRPRQRLPVGDPRVTSSGTRRTPGVGGAIITGHRQAIELGADIDVVMAGDAQMDPAYLPALLDPIIEGGLRLRQGKPVLLRRVVRGRCRGTGSSATSCCRS